MKNLLFSFMAIVLFTNLSFGQRTTSTNNTLLEAEILSSPIIQNSEELEIKNLATSLHDYEFQISQIPKAGINSANNSQISALNASILETKNLLVPKCVTYLKVKWNFNDNDIVECFGSLSNHSIIPGVCTLIGIKQFDPNSIDATQFSGIAGELSSRVGPTVMGCLLEAVGVNAITELLEGGIQKMGKSAVKKLLKKVVSKYLGAVGAVLAGYDFGECMDWW